MSLKEQVINGIITREGGYSNNPADSGGETMYGITIAVARKYGYSGPMRSLPRSTAFEIYSSIYWDALNLDAVEKLSPAVAAELADTGVNMGTSIPGLFLQKSLNVLNRRSKDYPNITVDGQIGKQSIAALQAFIFRRGAEGITVLVRMLNAMQGARYIDIASQEPDDKDEEFIYGWFLHRVLI